MFLRVVRATGGKGVKHEYVRVVEAFRENGKTRHRTILNLGRRGVTAEPLRHRQTKEAATDMFSLQPPRHIPTLPCGLAPPSEPQRMTPRM